MIKYSDNQSYFLLNKYIHDISPTEDLVKDTYIDLGIINPRDMLDQTISVKSYASIFVELYHNSFFNTADKSNRALSILSDTDWNLGLVAGVPSGVKVAHKFGERAVTEDNSKQLHDCGVVYYPDNPYLLCVMTRGSDFNKLSQIIATISKMFYEEFDSRKL
jgi:beta-lactamase class A